jgi:hypothetical protein
MNAPFQPHRDARLPHRRDGDTWSVARLVGSRVDGLCMVTGVTPDGARLMSVLELAVGEEITIDMGGEARFAARVRWIEGAVAGIGFAAPMLSGGNEDKLSDSIDRRPRFRRCVPVTLERHGREQVGELVDISQFGACIATPDLPWLRLGSGVVLEIDGCDPFDAEVRWRRDGRIGVAFRSHVQLWKLDKQLQTWAGACRGCRREDCATPGEAVRSIRGRKRAA